MSGARAIAGAVVLALTAGAAPVPAAPAPDPFAGGGGAMVIADLRDGEIVRWGDTSRRRPPCSTFKIPNTLIALAAGAVDPQDSALAWDPVRDPRRENWSDAWAQDQDLESAFRRSTVWYYQELARRIGAERMQRELDRLAYGNRDLSAGIDRFWLGASLEISPDEQVAVLDRIFGARPPFAPAHVALLRRLMARDEDGGRWGHKTGACPSDGIWHGWLVGWVADAEGGLTALFALAVEGPDYRSIAETRIPLARRLLERRGLLPEGGSAGE